MAVIIGSARIDENGKAHGGAAGDQTSKEVSTQNWYKHSKGWRVFRAKNSAAAAKIAQAMKAACNNNKIGYDQYQRDTLYNLAKNVGFDPAKVTTACETDCSALVRVCCAFAGITVGNFRTYNEPSMLLGTGAFVELTGSKYTDQSDYLGAGDILCTPVSGHTVVVLTNGPKYEGSVISQDYVLGDRILKKGMTGTDVKQLQNYLIQLGYNLGSYGADGDFGSATESAVKQFQKDNGLTVDGQYGPKSHAAMLTVLEKNTGISTITGNTVTITGDSVNVRKGPGTSYGILKTVHKGDKLERVDTTGWVCVKYNDEICWVSEKYISNKICTASSLNVRKGPNTSYTFVGIVKNGYTFDVVGTDGWVPVLISGVIYWVSGKYVA